MNFGLFLTTFVKDGMNQKGLQKDGEKETHEYHLVGSEEADMQERKISYISPLGEAMMGKKKGESFTFETPNGKQNYTVKSVG